MTQLPEADAQPAALDIAIVGMAGRFPGAKDLDEFWQNLRDGVESIAALSEEELRAAGVSAAEYSAPSYVRAAPVLRDIALFDAEFFGYSPLEAKTMDPQQRFLLECAWEALEDAGYDPEQVREPIGVFAGARMSSYVVGLYADPVLAQPQNMLLVLLGNDISSLSTRVSYKLNLRGPSTAVQSGCSTSLVAVHLACQSLLFGECRMALAGGVTINVPHTAGYVYEEGSMLSPDGHCNAFDANARGTVFGSGMGVVVLKRLEDALADGDTIHAVIKGSATNNDGSLKASFTAPSVEGQSAVIIDALASSGIDAETIGYVEAHATATALGDPIEVRALTNAFRASTRRRGFCRIGTVKSNMGHLDAAAGMAGLLKATLALKHGQIPPTLNYREPNPEIDFAASPFVVNTALTPWERNGAPRRAGISSFGFGGTNAHVIIEEAPAEEPSGPSREWQLVLLSARTTSALERAGQNLVAHLRLHPEQPLADVAYTLKVGRRAFGRRMGLLCRGADEAAAALEAGDPQLVMRSERAAAERPVVLMFPGQGAQYQQMALGLYAAEPAFRAELDRCAELLRPHLGCELRELLASPELDQTRYAQPALFAVEYALARLLLGWGVRPHALIGHSIGEYVAACLAGVFSLADALKLVAARGRLMQGLPPGAMLSVPLPEAELRPLLGEELDLAAVNGPALAVVSGPDAAVAALERRLQDQGVECRRLHTSHAFHSALMEPIVAPFAELLRGISLKAPSTPFISNVSGTWITEAQATDPAYWAQHLRGTVRFADGLRRLTAEGERILLEVGPGRTLSTLARQTAGDTAPLILSTLRHPQDEQPDQAFLLTAVARLWLAGLTLDWGSFYAGERRRRVPLPTYPFERQPYWAQSDLSALGAGAQRAALEKRPDLDDWFYVPSWKQTAPPEPLRSGDLAETPHSWLIFADTWGLGERIVRRLRDEGQIVAMVMPGDGFATGEDGAYWVAPGQPGDYLALLAALREAGQLPTKIVHLWAVTPDDRPVAADPFVQLQARGFSSLIGLAQALGAEETPAPVGLTVVANRLHDVSGGEPVSPAKATMLGPCRVIPREYLQIGCRSLDFVTPHMRPELAEALAERILAEALAESPDTVVAYRGARRWSQSIEPARLPSPRRSRLRQRGVYLITGGLGGIGMTFAEHLARSYQARLVLAGRSAFPARAGWDDWLRAHPADDPTSRTIGRLRELEAMGAEVLTGSADVTSAEQLRELVAQANRRFGPLSGVIHAAGVPGGGVIQLKTPDALERVLAPKTKGTLALAEACRDQPIDFMLLCSSLTSMVGELGQADYAAANAFLDAFAHQQAAAGGPRTVTVNWDSWQAVGMAARTEVPPELQGMHQQMLQGGLLPAEGIDVLERALGQETTPQVLVSTKDLPARIAAIHAMTRAMLVEAQEQAQAMANRVGYARPELATAYVAPSNQYEQHVAEVWQQVLGIERVGVHDSFFDLGGHSLLVTQLTNKLHRIYQVDISIRSLFDNPTVAGMARVIAQGYLEQAADTTRPIKELARETRGAERQGLLEAYWKKKLARVLQIEVAQLPADGSLAGYDMQAIVGDVQWSFEQDFGMIVYPHEIVRLGSIGQMAEFTATEIDRLDQVRRNKATAPASHYADYEARSQLERRVQRTQLVRPARKNPPIVFSHSCVRSGSTIFRVMLAGHPALHAPPELGILWYDTMGEWRRSLTDPSYGHGFHWAAQGLQWTFMELLGCDPDEARAYMDDLVANDTPVHAIYARLQELSAPRLLVDKSPSYTMSLETLQRAEAIFDGPKYIHLVRHPYAVIESVVRIRLDKLFSPVIYGGEDVDSAIVAEKVWTTSNRNLLTFLEGIAPERQLRVYYEELVRRPEATMRGVCAFLELPYDPAVIEPYDNKRERMISGIGDPNILKHDSLDPRLAETWRTVKLPWRLGEPARQLAAELGYELPAEDEAAPPPADALAALDGVDPAQLAELMASVRQLSPEEVQALLAEMESRA